MSLEHGACVQVMREIIPLLERFEPAIDSRHFKLVMESDSDLYELAHAIVAMIEVRGIENEYAKVVRDAWCKWAASHPAPKSSWLVPWEDLDAEQRDADRAIARALIRHFMLKERMGSVQPVMDAVALLAPFSHKYKRPLW
jgi:hypothetical protein